MSAPAPAAGSRGRAETIVAVATPAGRGGIGIVRVSGALAGEIGRAVTGASPPPRRAVVADFRDGSGSVLDRGIVLYFPQPGSFTGEDVLELQGHGSPVVLQMLVRRCLELGARLAEPGEFTLRAFLNDKLDLAQAEAVADLIDATTGTAARAAMRSLAGEFSRRTERLVDDLVRVRALIEASLDFPEEDVDFVRAADAAGQLAALGEALRAAVRAARQGALLREGIHVVLVGQPNVGKSSLLNRLVGDEIAIVTPVPGTTRDTLRESIQIEGVPVHVVDTAGLRETEDTVERAGMARTWAAVERADLVLLVVEHPHGVGTDDRRILDRLPAHLPIVVVHNKIDVDGRAPGVEREAGQAEDGRESGGEAHAAAVRGGEAHMGEAHDREALGGAVRGGAVHVWLSARTGAGVELLRAEVLRLVGYSGAEDAGGAFIARERHLVALRSAEGHVGAAARLIGGTDAAPALELVAEELRRAQEALFAITGEFTPDDLLGEIFGRFCIGK
jgi:tRNA modification GTPase